MQSSSTPRHQPTQWEESIVFHTVTPNISPHWSRLRPHYHTNQKSMDWLHWLTSNQWRNDTVFHTITLNNQPGWRNHHLQYDANRLIGWVSSFHLPRYDTLFNGYTPSPCKLRHHLTHSATVLLRVHRRQTNQLNVWPRHHSQASTYFGITYTDNPSNASIKFGMSTQANSPATQRLVWTSITQET